jgi:DNA-binding response OmpR family regulator
MRILIVDDDSDLSNALARVFRDLGHEVTTAWNGAEGLNELRKNEFYVMLSDYNMPIMDGFQMCSTARRLYPTLKIFMMSGDHSNKAPEGIILLKKPMCMKTLLSILLP